MMEEEGDYPQIADRMYASMLDNWTEVLILTESYETHIGDWLSIFTNPKVPNGTSYTDDMRQYDDGSAEIYEYYVRYWMGFRTIIRLLLCVFNYWQIRRYLVIAFFSLFSLVICSLAKHIDEKNAFLFALSIILVRPHIVAQSLQFSCCFIIMFVAMLLVPWIHRHSRLESLFFMELGIITMYFDFYTTPILTFAMPMIYLCILKAEEGKNVKVRSVVVNFVIWIISYVMMWIAKLLLTTIFTDINAIRDGMIAFFGRVGIVKVSGLEDKYNPVQAIKCAFEYWSSYPDLSAQKVTVAAIAVVILLWGCIFVRNKKSMIHLKQHGIFLLIACFPILWFAVAAQPTIIHASFQYRGIAVCLWSWLTYMHLSSKKVFME